MSIAAEKLASKLKHLRHCSTTALAVIGCGTANALRRLQTAPALRATRG